MANATDPFAKAVHGTDPQNLIEAILRNRIYENRYWKEHCFGLTADSLIEKAIKLEYVGGTYSANSKPTPFICLVLKLLQIQPDNEIIYEYINAEDYKYLRVLGAFYLRIVGRPAEVYRHLEPLLADYRKLAKRSTTGWEVIHIDELIDELLTSEYCCGIALPLLPKRGVLEAAGHLQPRKSMLDDEIAAEVEEETAQHSAALQVLQSATEEAVDMPTRIKMESEKLSSAEHRVKLGSAHQEVWPSRRSRSRSSPRDSNRRHDSRDHRRSSGDRDRSRDRHHSSGDRDRSRDRHHRGDRDRSRDRHHSSGDRDRSRDRRHGSGDRDRSRDRHRRRSRSRSYGRGADRYYDRSRRSRSRSYGRRHDRSRSRSRSRGRHSHRDGSRDEYEQRRDNRSRRSTSASSWRGDSRHGHQSVASPADGRRPTAPHAASVGEKEASAGVQQSSKAPLPVSHVAKVAAKLFKKSALAAPQESSTVKPTAPEGSVEYWNDMRTKLGLKPLKG